MGTLNILEYSKALLITRELITGLPSSEKATAPPFISSPISDMSSPFPPLVIVATGKTFIRPFSASILVNLTSAWLSITGWVLGMVHTDV